MDKEWIIGFIEAEGCLRIKKGKNKNTVAFAIGQKDEEIIKKLDEELPIRKGSINQGKDETWYLHTSNLADCIKLYIYFLGEFKTEHKLEQLEEWRKFFRSLDRENMKDRKWLPIEDSILEKMKDTHSDKEISEYLFRTPRAIQHRRLKQTEE